MRLLLIASAGINLLIGLGVILTATFAVFRPPTFQWDLLKGLLFAATLGLGALFCRHGLRYLLRPRFETARDSFLMASIGVALGAYSALSATREWPRLGASDGIGVLLPIALAIVAYRFVFRAKIRRVFEKAPPAA